jgi:hypothetical protein
VLITREVLAGSKASSPSKSSEATTAVPVDEDPEVIVLETGDSVGNDNNVAGAPPTGSMVHRGSGGIVASGVPGIMATTGPSGVTCNTLAIPDKPQFRYTPETMKQEVETRYAKFIPVEW